MRLFERRDLMGLTNAEIVVLDIASFIAGLLAVLALSSVASTISSNTSSSSVIYGGPNLPLLCTS